MESVIICVENLGRNIENKTLYDTFNPLGSILSGKVARPVVTDIWYVHGKCLETIQDKLKKGEDVPVEISNMIHHATLMDEVTDDEIMVPGDMAGVDGDFEDFEDMVYELGRIGACEALIKAHEHLKKTKEDMPEDERPTVMTKAEVQQLLETGLDEEERVEDILLEGEGRGA